MATKSKENENPVMELIGQLMRVKKGTGSCHIDDLYKSKTIDQETNEEIPIYSIISKMVFHFTTGGTIAEVLGDYLQQCEDFGSQPFIEPKIFNALSAEMIELEMQKH
jgi:hypothetical protein